MSKIALNSNASGTGVFTIASPNSNTDRTLTLPDESGDFVLSENGAITATSFKVGLWEIKLDTNDLRFVYNGTDVFKVTTTGDVIALANVTAYGTP